MIPGSFPPNNNLLSDIMYDACRFPYCTRNGISECGPNWYTRSTRVLARPLIRTNWACLLAGGLKVARLSLDAAFGGCDPGHGDVHMARTAIEAHAR